MLFKKDESIVSEKHKKFDKLKTKLILILLLAVAGLAAYTYLSQ